MRARAWAHVAEDYSVDRGSESPLCCWERVFVKVQNLTDNVVFITKQIAPELTVELTIHVHKQLYTLKGIYTYTGLIFPLDTVYMCHLPYTHQNGWDPWSFSHLKRKPQPYSDIWLRMRTIELIRRYCACTGLETPHLSLPPSTTLSLHPTSVPCRKTLHEPSLDRRW